jgi:hypothetical protein
LRSSGQVAVHHGARLVSRLWRLRRGPVQRRRGSVLEIGEATWVVDPISNGSHDVADRSLVKLIVAIDIESDGCCVVPVRQGADLIGVTRPQSNGQIWPVPLRDGNFTKEPLHLS